MNHRPSSKDNLANFGVPNFYVLATPPNSKFDSLEKLRQPIPLQRCRSLVDYGNTLAHDHGSSCGSHDELSVFIYHSYNLP